MRVSNSETKALKDFTPADFDRSNHVEVEWDRYDRRGGATMFEEGSGLEVGWQQLLDCYAGIEGLTVEFWT